MHFTQPLFPSYAMIFIFLLMACFNDTNEGSPFLGFFYSGESGLFSDNYKEYETEDNVIGDCDLGSDIRGNCEMCSKFTKNGDAFEKCCTSDENNPSSVRAWCFKFLRWTPTEPDQVHLRPGDTSD